MYIPRLVMCITKLLTDITKLVIKIFLSRGKFLLRLFRACGPISGRFLLG